MLFGFFLIIRIFVYLPSPLFYCLGLLSIVCLCFFWALYYSLFHRLLCLLIIILYIGAMIVLISYVAATIPNFLPVRRVYLNWFFFCVFRLISRIGFSFEDHYYYSSPLAGSFSDFFFLSSGLWVFSLLVFFLFLILLICSFLVIQKGTFRSI